MITQTHMGYKKGSECHTDGHIPEEMDAAVVLGIVRRRDDE